MTGRQGPIPEPVATRTTFLKRGAMARTPQAGIPRFQMCVGILDIVSPVQSPAFEMTREKPFVPGFAMVAKACHSRRGLREMRTAVPG